MNVKPLIFIVLFALPGIGYADDIAYVNIGSALPVNPVDAITYFEDREGNLTLDDVRLLSFNPLSESGVDFGYTKSKVWLRFGVSNSMDTNRLLVLRTFVRFMRPLEIYQSNGAGEFAQILFNDEHSPFGARPHGLRHLAIEFELNPKDSAEFYVRFGAGGRATLDLAIDSSANIVAEQQTTTLQVAVFLSVIGTLIIVNLFYYLAIRYWGYLQYILMEFAFVVYVSHMDGFTFQYLWPDNPGFNANATPLLGFFCLFFALLFSISFLRSKYYTPNYYRMLMGLLILICLYGFSTLFVESRITNQIGLYLNFVVTVVLFPHAIYVIWKGHLAARYYLAGWMFIYLFVGYFSATLVGWLPVIVDPLASLKFGMVAEAIVLSLGLADRYRRLNLENEKNQRELVEQLNARITDSRERVRLEQDRQTALTQVAERSRTLAIASHDIVQPIRSLRFLMAQDGELDRMDMRAIVDDMDEVIASALDEASGSLKDASTDLRTDLETMLTQSANEHQQQALDKGIFIRVFCPSLTVSVSRLSLQRCLGNLVSNAISFTESGGVLIAARKRHGDVLVQVFDTGRGISKEELDRLTSPLEKGTDSLGHGLGLAIVKEICDESMWEFSIQSVPEKGTCCSILLPGVLE